MNVGVGYAISSNQIKLFLSSLKSGRLVDHATLGATVVNDADGRVVVSNILPNCDGLPPGAAFTVMKSCAWQVAKCAAEMVSRTYWGPYPVTGVYRSRSAAMGKFCNCWCVLDGVHTPSELIDLVASELMPGSPEEPDEDVEDQADKEADSAQEAPPAGIPGFEWVQPQTELVESLLEQREGFANYYFNRINRDRVWDSVRRQGDFEKAGNHWQWQGTLAGEGTSVKVRLEPAGEHLAGWYAGTGYLRRSVAF